MKFKPGDMVVFVRVPGWDYSNGSDKYLGRVGTITGVCTCYWYMRTDRTYYHTDWHKDPKDSSGCNGGYVEDCLRLIPPPEPAEWKDCAWQPQEIASLVTD